MAKNKYTDLDDGTDDKWKKKYLASLEELEKKEMEWTGSEKNLRALVSHLTQAADTSSEKLNKQLGVLRDAINKGFAANKLTKAIDEVADSILGLEAIRKNKSVEPQASLQQLLNKIKPAGKIESKLTKLSKKISKTSTSKEVSPFLEDIAKLLVYGLGLADSNKEKGFFSSLISKKEASQAENSVEQAHVEPQPTKEETQENLDAAIESLISLLGRMILPEDLQVEANLVKNQLSQATDKADFIKALECTISITANILARVKKEKNDIEDFLKQLTGRLQELDHDIRETARIRLMTHEHGQKLTHGMKSEMQTMEEGLKNINNLDDLKTSIQSRVIMLRDHVDNFIIKEGEKNKEAISVIEQLKNKVKEMESETEELKQEVEKERQQTLKDVLTQIPNRLSYEERLSLEMANYRRNKTSFVLVVWDIDLFKKVNDTHGHAAGDQVLKLVASILNKNMRETDFIARYGGEEFVSLLPNTNIKEAQFVADKLRELIASSQFHFRDEDVAITVSAGFAQIKEGEESGDLFIRADKALYNAKESGRNKCKASV